ncbi:DDE superfamily endonuclease [Hirsutella rhossiliensis]
MTLKRPRSIYTEDIMANAIIDVTKNGLSQYRAAQKYDIPQQSISDRLKGQVALADQIQPRQLLMGRNWVSKFINRHPDIKNKRGRRQEANRFNAFTPRAVHWFFDIREKEYGWIKPENTVNVDEGGIMSGFGLDSLVVGSADPKRKALLKGPQSRNWTSFIEAITADGRVLTPGIIFKGKELQKQWFLTEFGKIADWHYITSPNGWTDNHIAIEWLERMDMEVMQRMHGWPHAF